jgi:SpoVK/Ycf46/Vps4 family AAA+-type ATPase
LLRCDLGGAKSKWVGESEANIRQVFAVAEAVGRCVLWIDEIEKALGGATGGAADGGVSSDALGTFLSWLQERKGSVFVIATANDVSKLPPELLRKGRFDEMFFVDLPTLAERREILTVTLRQYARDAATVDVAKIAGACGDFTGSEVAAIVPDALFAAFADGERALTTDDLLGVALSIVPLAKTASEKVKALREWSNGRARPSSLPEINAATGADRNLDL